MSIHRDLEQRPHLLYSSIVCSAMRVHIHTRTAKRRVCIGRSISSSLCFAATGAALALERNPFERGAALAPAWLPAFQAPSRCAVSLSLSLHRSRKIPLRRALLFIFS